MNVLEKETKPSVLGSESNTSATTLDPTSAVHFSCKSWKSRALQVFDSQTNQVLYTVDTKLRKPNLIYKHGEDGPEFGTAVFHTLSSKIDLDVNGRSIEMKLKKMLSSTYTYTSRAFGNDTVSWESKSHWRDFDYVLLDQNAQPIAKCSAPYWSGNFSGKIEFLESRIQEEKARQEILVGGIALMYLTLVTYYAAIM